MPSFRVGLSNPILRLAIPAFKSNHPLNFARGSLNRCSATVLVTRCATVLVGLILMSATLLAAQQLVAPNGAGQLEHNSSRTVNVCEPSTLGSPYIPVDSWVYPAMLRLYSMGYIDQVYLGMRPWTRASLSHMLEDIGPQIEDANTYEVSTADEAQKIYSALSRFLNYDNGMQCLTYQGNYHIESIYSVGRGISGTPLRDSFHLGSTTTAVPTRVALTTILGPAAMPPPAVLFSMRAVSSKAHPRLPVTRPRCRRHFPI